VKEHFPENILHELPEGWSTRRMKHVGRFAASGIDKKSMPGEVPVSMVNYTDVYNNRKRIIDGSIRYMQTTCSEKKLEEFNLLKGDLLFTPSSETIDEIGYSALVTENLPNTVFSYHLIRFRSFKPLQLNFRKYLCQNHSVLGQFAYASKGTTRKILGRDEFKNAFILLPPLPIQRLIASYLDRETDQIDALVAEKEQMLTLLEEKRAALISRAVTRGLDPEAPLKPSGYAWLGDIPTHWKVKRSKQILREHDERSATGNEELLTVSHITGVTKRSEKEVNMFEAGTTEGYKRCSPGNLVINTLWAWMGAMGIAWEAGIVSPAYHVYKLSSELLPGYVDALVRTPVFAKEVTRFSKGVWSSRLRLYPEGLYEVRLPVPPLEEQQQIIDAIASERQQTAEMETALSKSIELLEERRSALITAAVTGQIEPETMNP